MAQRYPERRAVLIGIVAAGAAGAPAWAKDYGLDDPVPPGATGKVLPIQGRVTQIQGLGLAVSGKAEALGAAMKDLGARATAAEVDISLPGDVLFDFDKATLRAAALPVLQKVVVVMQAYPAYAAVVGGHTDAKGSKAYNQGLSERRAVTVKTWLQANGAANRMTTQGFGGERPVAPNTHPDGSDDPDGRQKNRRVEIKLLKP